MIRIAAALVAAAVAAAPSAPEPTVPDVGPVLAIDKEKTCFRHVCVMPEEVLDQILDANASLYLRLQAEVASKAKPKACGSLTVTEPSKRY